MGFLFGKDLAKLIIGNLRPEGALKKTQTRRLDNKNEGFLKVDDKISVVYTGKGHVKWRVGQDYAICVKRGGVAVARFRITEIRNERFCDISNVDVTAEGFASREEFFERLRLLYGKKFDLTQFAWVINFEYIPDSYQGGL